MARRKNKEAKKERALERLEVTSQRTPEEQTKRLDMKFGKGLGAKKERAKLARRIEDRKNAPVKVEE